MRDQMVIGNRRGKVQTVLGLVSPEDLGMTITHEHLLIDFTSVLIVPEGASGIGKMHEKINLENLGWVRYNWASNIDNLQLLDEERSTFEAAQFYNSGGGTIVDVTSIGLGRDPKALARISRATRLNVVMGAGHYVEHAQADDFAALSEQEIADSIVKDIGIGADSTGVRSGIIGEVGCSWPWSDAEKRSVHGAVIAQRETGAPLLIHPGRQGRAPLEIINAIDEWGGDLDHTVMGHIERTIYDAGQLRELAASGVYMNYDLFGHVCSYYPFAPDTYMPTDHQRIDQIEDLLALGYGDRILLAHDVCSKHRLRSFGGHGWDHIPTRVVPRMLDRGISKKQINRLLVDNPARMLTFS